MQSSDISSHREIIGFIPLKRNVVFSKGEIQKLDTFDEAKLYMHENSNADGYYYPPVVARYELKSPTYEKPDFAAGPLPRSKRPAHLFKLPASHQIVLDFPYSVEPRNNECMFLVQFLAFIYGTRAHITEWWIDGRVPQKTSNDYILDEMELPYLTDMAFSTWSECKTPEQQLHLTNLLYMHNRVFSYEWDWEQFTVAYMVFDGCYRYLQRYTDFKGVPEHASRLKLVLEEIRIPLEEDRIKKFVKLRNDLFHETLWESKQPGISASHDAFMASRQMKKICTRILLFILGYRGEYLAKPWWFAGSSCVLRRPE